MNIALTIRKNIILHLSGNKSFPVLRDTVCTIILCKHIGNIFPIKYIALTVVISADCNNTAVKPSSYNMVLSGTELFHSVPLGKELLGNKLNNLDAG